MDDCQKLLLQHMAALANETLAVQLYESRVRCDTLAPSWDNLNQDGQKYWRELARKTKEF